METSPETQLQERLALVRAEQERRAAFASIQSSIENLERIKPPSTSKYIFLFWVAGGADVCDIIAFVIEWLGLATAGTLSFVVWLFSLIIDLVADLIIYLLAKGAREKTEKLRKVQEELPEVIRLLSRQYLRGLKAARNVKVLRPLATKVGLIVATARKSPMAKQWLAMVLDIIPGIEVIPWRTIGIYLLRRDEKKMHQDAQLLIEQYKELAGELAA